jgi:hypothetical protein
MVLDPALAGQVESRRSVAVAYFHDDFGFDADLRAGRCVADDAGAAVVVAEVAHFEVLLGALAEQSAVAVYSTEDQVAPLEGEE